MKKHLPALAIFLVISTFSSFSQTLIYETKEVLDFYSNIKLVNPGGELPAYGSDIKGSPYLSEEFEKGTIFTTTKEKFIDIPLRLNIYNDNFEFKTSDGNVLEIAAPEIIEKVKLNNLEMVYLPYEGEKKGNGFFIILEEGKDASLYAHLEIVFKDSPRKEAFTMPEPPQFIKKPNSHYVRFGKGKAIKIGNKNELIQLFPNHQDEIIAFVKKNKIKPNKPDKLKELIKFYNSLK
uniref:hypothetical protein n=1 Tax=uncultured Draconibacterium sp. TaxID=1573823 RepID=UPI0032178057